MNTITTIADVRGEPDDEPIVDVSKQPLRRRISAAAEDFRGRDRRRWLSPTSL